MGSQATRIFRAEGVGTNFDRVHFSRVDMLRALAGRTQLGFHQANVLQVESEVRDLLFIATRHVCEELMEECRIVFPSMTPSGVEHHRDGTISLGPYTRASFDDAVRR